MTPIFFDFVYSQEYYYVVVVCKQQSKNNNNDRVMALHLHLSIYKDDDYKQPNPKHTHKQTKDRILFKVMLTLLFFSK